MSERSTRCPVDLVRWVGGWVKRAVIKFLRPYKLKDDAWKKP